MKKAALFIIPLFIYFSGLAQNIGYHYNEEFYFVKEVPVMLFHGKNFCFEIAVRANPSDTLSKVRIHGVGVGERKDDFLNSDFKLENRQEQEWMIYSIRGKVSPQAQKLWFYSAVNGNGDFFFDDVTCYIEEAPGKWKQLELYNASFEVKSNDIFKGYYVSKPFSATIRTKLTGAVYKTGKKSLHVQTRGQLPLPLTNTSRN